MTFLSKQDYIDEIFFRPKNHKKLSPRAIIFRGRWFHWQVSGIENVPPVGPLIIVANHQSYFDPTLLSTSLPRKIVFLAKSELFKGFIASWFLRSYGAFPLNRDSSDIRAYRWALNHLSHDGAVVLFPEGTRTNGSMRKAHTGVARIALKSSAPLLPIGITGTERIQGTARIFSPTGRIKMNVGSVFSIPSIDGNPSREVLNSLTYMIMQRVAALLPSSYHGIYRFQPKNENRLPSSPKTTSNIENRGWPLS